MAEGTWYPWNHPGLIGVKGHGYRRRGNVPPLLRREQVMRQARVMFDFGAEYSEGLVSSHQHLHELINLDQFQTYRFAEAGPPRKFPVLEKYSKEFVEGWLSPTASDYEDSSYWIHDEGDRLTSSGFSTRDHSFDPLSFHVNHGVIQSNGGLEACTTDLSVLLIAESINADILITNRQFLLENPLGMMSPVACVSNHNAIPLLSLYLRLQDQEFRQGPVFGERWGLISFGVPWVARWRLVATNVSNLELARRAKMEADGNVESAMLHQTVMERLSWSLKLRDDILGWTADGLGPRYRDEIANTLDSMAIWLLGGFDASAAVANVAIGGSETNPGVNWLNKDFRTRISRYDGGSCSALVDDGTNGQALLRAIRAIRNTIHGQSNTPTYFDDNGEPTKVMLTMSPGRRQELIDQLRVLGDPLHWGIVEMWEGKYFVDPKILIERLIPESFELMNRLFERIPGDRFLGPCIRMSGGPDFETSPDGIARLIAQYGLRRSEIRFK